MTLSEATLSFMNEYEASSFGMFLLYEPSRVSSVGGGRPVLGLSACSVATAASVSLGTVAAAITTFARRGLLTLDARGRRNEVNIVFIGLIGAANEYEPKALIGADAWKSRWPFNLPNLMVSFYCTEAKYGFC